MQTILLVEDNDDDIHLMRRAWRKAQLPFPLMSVADGEQAIEYLSGTGCYGDREAYPLPGLVLLDLKLPMQSGLKVLEWIRSQPRLASLLVVMLSSSKKTVDIEKAYRMGVNSYLVKPGTVEQLLEMVQAIHLYWLKLNQAPMLRKA
jgi:CheY-like chemotaxis protein